MASVLATLNCKLIVTADPVLTAAVSSLIELVPPLLSCPTVEMVCALVDPIVHHQVSDALDLVGRAARQHRRRRSPAEGKRVADRRRAGRMLGHSGNDDSLPRAHHAGRQSTRIVNGCRSGPRN